MLLQILMAIHLDLIIIGDSGAGFIAELFKNKGTKMPKTIYLKSNKVTLETI